MEKNLMTDYKYMLYLHRIYRSPALLLDDKTVPLFRKRFLLKKWQEERTRYLFEHCRDHDYINDREITLLLTCLKLVKQPPQKYL